MDKIVYEICNAINHIAYAVETDGHAYYCAKWAATAVVAASGKRDHDDRLVLTAARLSSAIYQRRMHDAKVQQGTFIPRDETGAMLDHRIIALTEELSNAAHDARIA